MSLRGNHRGLSRAEFANKPQVVRNSLPTYAFVLQQSRDPLIATATLGLASIAVWLLPSAWELVLGVQIVYAIWVVTGQSAVADLPHFLPRGTRARHDPNHWLPGAKKSFGKPAGDVFLGVERESKKQVWFAFKDWLRHALVTGTTGSGKTELLISIAYNFLAAGGNGLMFADPKADPKAAFKLAWIAKRFGREDDLFVCNYIAPEVDDVTELDYQTTNTCNPTQLGSAKEVATMLMSLLPKNEGGANAVFAENAITLVQVLSNALVYLRDQKRLELSWGTFRDYLNLPAVINLAQNQNLSGSVRREVSLFVFSIAGVDKNQAAEKQSQTALDQFGYIASYCQRGLATLTGSFGYIYDCKYGDFAYRDVVRRHRILLSVLPSLQNTQEEISMLGKIDLYGKKQALSEGLASRLEGGLGQINRAQSSVESVPSLNIMDEYKYISVPGMSVAATQGRSLGWASVVGVQSYAGLTVDGEDEADEWLENTSTKFIGSAQGDSTFNKMSQIVGSEFVARSEGKTRSDNLFGSARDKDELRYEKQDVLDIRDIRAQIEGEFTVIVRDREIRMQSMFVATPIDTPDANKSINQIETAGILLNSFVDLPQLDSGMGAVIRRRNRLFTALLK